MDVCLRLSHAIRLLSPCHHVKLSLPPSRAQSRKLYRRPADAEFRRAGVLQKELTIELRTDSLSGKQLLDASDVQRRSRHIEIRIEWIRGLMNSGKLALTLFPEP